LFKLKFFFNWKGPNTFAHHICMSVVPIRTHESLKLYPLGYDDARSLDKGKALDNAIFPLPSDHTPIPNAYKFILLS